MTCKIIQIEVYGDDDNPRVLTFVGNEFSPDPVDMLQRVSVLYPKKNTEKTLMVQVNVDIDSDMSYIRRLLSKNGYVQFVPSTISVVQRLGDFYNEP